ncbi:hypothetical protein AAMO2058_000834200 [Amorphochlora amoebiformis]
MDGKHDTEPPPSPPVRVEINQQEEYDDPELMEKIRKILSRQERERMLRSPRRICRLASVTISNGDSKDEAPDRWKHGIIDEGKIFLERVRELGTFRPEAARLRLEIEDANTAAQHTARRFVESSQDLFRKRSILRNIDAGLALVGRLQHVFDMVEAAQREMGQSRLYSAAKILTRTATELARSLEGQLPLGLMLLGVCKRLTGEVRKIAMLELDRWLDRARNSCQSFGAMILVEMDRLQQEQEAAERAGQQSVLAGVHPPFARSLFVPQPPQKRDGERAVAWGGVSEILREFGLLEGLGVDYGRLYDGLRVMELLGGKEAYKRRYQTTRREQMFTAASMMHDVSVSGKTAMEVYPSYFATLAGLILIEVMILEGQQDPDNPYPDLWDSCEQFHSLVDTALNKAVNEVLAPQLKRFLPRSTAAAEQIGPSSRHVSPRSKPTHRRAWSHMSGSSIVIGGDDRDRFSQLKSLDDFHLASPRKRSQSSSRIRQGVSVVGGVKSGDGDMFLRVDKSEFTDGSKSRHESDSFNGDIFDNFLSFRSLVGLLRFTLQSAGFDARPLASKLADSCREEAGAALERRCVKQLLTAVSKDKYEPLSVPGTFQYLHLVQSYGLDPPPPSRIKPPQYEPSPPKHQLLDGKLNRSKREISDMGDNSMSNPGNTTSTLFPPTMPSPPRSPSPHTPNTNPRRNLSLSGTLPYISSTTEFGFPRSVPFSLLVPRVCAVISDFATIYTSLHADGWVSSPRLLPEGKDEEGEDNNVGLDRSGREMVPRVNSGESIFDAVIRAIDRCLANLNSHLSAIVGGEVDQIPFFDFDMPEGKGDSTSRRPPRRTVAVSQAVQVGINAAYLVKACRWLEAYVLSILHQPPPPSDPFSPRSLPPDENPGISAVAPASHVPLGNVDENLVLAHAAQGRRSRRSYEKKNRSLSHPRRDMEKAQAGRKKKNGKLSGGRCFMARLLFKQTQTLCEDSIFKLVNSKVDLLMALAEDINWAPTNRPPRKEPHPYADDLVAYLDTTFASLAFIRKSVREDVPRAGCKRIAERWLGILSVRSTRSRFNLIGVCELERDLAVLEAFARRQPVPGLVRVFGEVRQLVNLLLSGKVARVLDITESKKSGLERLDLYRVVDILHNFKGLRSSTASSHLPNGIRNISKSEVDRISKKLKKALKVTLKLVKAKAQSH